MNKYNKLFKKLESFERFAFYGNKETFLRSIAQQEQTWEDIARQHGDLTEKLNVPPVNEDNKGKLELPEQVIVGTPPTPSFGDPETIKMLQIFLNKSLSNEIISGKRAPIQQEGKFGTETLSALKEWAKLNNVSTNNINELINIALKHS